MGDRGRRLVAHGPAGAGEPPHEVDVLAAPASPRRSRRTPRAPMRRTTRAAVGTNGTRLRGAHRRLGRAAVEGGAGLLVGGQPPRQAGPTTRVMMRGATATTSGIVEVGQQHRRASPSAGRQSASTKATSSVSRRRHPVLRAAAGPTAHVVAHHPGSVPLRPPLHRVGRPTRRRPRPPHPAGRGGRGWRPSSSARSCTGTTTVTSSTSARRGGRPGWAMPASSRRRTSR